MTFTFIALISFFAALVRSTLGFGESLIAVPLFLLFLPARTAVPLAVMLSVVIALVILIRDYRNVHFSSAKWLVLYAVLGIPFGVAVLVYAPGGLIKTILAILIIAYALYALYTSAATRRSKVPRYVLFLCGFTSGVLGGAYGLNGPPLVVYGNLRQWSATHFRATLQAYFLPVSLISVLIYRQQGLISTQVIDLFIFALLPSIPAIFIGRYLNKRLPKRLFFRYCYWGLIGIGILLLLTTYS